MTRLTVRQGADDRNLVAVDLEFDSVEQARAFHARLEAEIWPNSPHLDGIPAAQVYESVDAAV